MNQETATHEHTHRWDVGIDMTQRSHGAIRFAGWLRQRSTNAEELRGLHVASDAALRRHPGEIGEAVEAASAALEAHADEVGAGGLFERFVVLRSDAPERELGRIAERDSTYGLIVGRAAPIEGWSLLSLGRVTRRLLRSLPCPIVVVPPDLDVAQLGNGPIIVGVLPDPSAVPAVRLAQQLGARLGLQVLLLHTVEAAPVGSPVSLPGTPDLDERTRAASSALKRWAEHHGLSDIPRQVAVGTRGIGLLSAANREKATLLVCGSRHLSLAARIFQSSIGSELASHAACPVVVVPSDPPTP